MRRITHAVTVTVAALFLSASIGVGAASAAIAVSSGDASTTNQGIATFEGGKIDLRNGWGQAHACNIDETGAVQCYRTEADMDAALVAAGEPTPDTTTASAPVDPAMSSLTSTYCSSYLRLYDGTSFTGNVVNINLRLTYVSLSTYLFDNVTSSFKVGACDSRLYSGAAGGGSLYPGDTTANSYASSMLSGWSNAISSVYIM